MGAPRAGRLAAQCLAAAGPGLPACLPQVGACGMAALGKEGMEALKVHA